MCREVYLTPSCCKAMRDTHVIVASCCYPETEAGYDNSIKPFWAPTFELHLSLTRHHEVYIDKTVSKEIYSPKFCPFCGAAVPDLEKNPKPPKPLCKVTDGGYHCDTCSERLMACKCFAPEFAWRIKK